MKQDRRNVLKKSAVWIAAASVVGTVKAEAKEKSKKKIYYTGGKPPEKTPLFSGAVSFGNLLFIAGKGAHFQGDITSHTKHVLDEIEKELTNAGSSMQKVLKVNVCDRYRGTHRRLIAEASEIDFVHPGVVFNVVEIHVHLEDFLHG